MRGEGFSDIAHELLRTQSWTGLDEDDIAARLCEIMGECTATRSGADDNELGALANGCGVIAKRVESLCRRKLSVATLSD